MIAIPAAMIEYGDQFDLDNVPTFLKEHIWDYDSEFKGSSNRYHIYTLGYFIGFMQFLNQYKKIKNWHKIVNIKRKIMNKCFLLFNLIIFKVDKIDTAIINELNNLFKIFPNWEVIKKYIALKQIAKKILDFYSNLDQLIQNKNKKLDKLKQVQLKNVK